MTSDERAVLRANEAFYAAFRAHDLVAMDILWSREAPVMCVHPGWEPIIGRDAVLGAWRAIFEGDVPEVEVRDARASLLGDVACVVCLEVVSDADGERRGVMSATNLFVREGSGWRVVHHHAGPVAPDDEDEASEDEPRLLN